MGALHEGHLTLVRRAREECEFVVVSVFVNPTQFLPNEDFNKYPRTLEADAAGCQSAGVDIVFAPSACEMYPDGFDAWVEVGSVTDSLEGEIRPGHFKGVTTVCAKLFNIVCPDAAFFGRKDYQQLAVIKKMVRDLNMPLEIIPVDIVRESDGMAMSSRNRYLSADERKSATVLSKSLFAAKELYSNGERDSAVILKVASDILAGEPRLTLDYLVIVDSETLQPVNEIDGAVVILLAGRLGPVRLIDNIVLGDF
jgi:pantoate--beta-alanine ligase